MKILIAEDDFVSRKVLHQYLKPYGDAEIAVNGQEVVDAVENALDRGESYDVICLDIMMPKLDGQEALKKIRQLEVDKGIQYPNSSRVIMTTALSDGKNIMGDFKSGAEIYLTKPVDKQKLYDELERLGIKPE